RLHPAPRVPSRPRRPARDAPGNQAADRAWRPLEGDARWDPPLRRAQARRVGRGTGEVLGPRPVVPGGLRAVRPGQPRVVPQDHRGRRPARPGGDGTFRRRRGPGPGGRGRHLPGLPGALAGPGGGPQRGPAARAQGRGARPRHRPARRRPDAGADRGPPSGRPGRIPVRPAAGRERLPRRGPDPHQPRDRVLGNPRIALTNQPHREWVYRQAYHMGRHVIGYEVQKVLAAVDWIERQSGPGAKFGVAGYGEGGLIAFYAAAADERIDAALVSGYFGPRQRVWAEPIYRNVWGLLSEFGDAEIATLIAPRGLVVEHSEGPRVEGPPAVPAGRRGGAGVDA